MADIATNLTRIITAKSDLKTSIEAKGVSVPSATKIDGYAALVDQIQAGNNPDQSPYWTYDWQFIRPSGWPDLSIFNMTTQRGFVATFDCRDKIAHPTSIDGFAWYMGSGYSVTIKRGTIVGGAFVEAASTTYSTSGSYYEELPTNEGDYVVYQFIPSTNAPTFFFGNNVNNASNYNPIRINAVGNFNCVSCVEIIINAADLTMLPILRSPKLRHYEVKNFKNISSSNKYTRVKLGNCSQLEFLDLTFNTANGDMASTNLTECFHQCASLRKLNLTNWYTGSVTNMTYMFNGCAKLDEITGINSLNTGSVTNMSYMFNGCAALQNLSITNWNTANVTTMTYMFNGCANLVALDLSSFNTAKITTFAYMFKDCYNLQTLTLSTSFKATLCTSAYYMFANCQSMETNPLSGATWDSGLITDMRFMFYCNYNLTEMDMSGWDWTRVAANYCSNMFFNCYKLRKVVFPATTAAIHNDIFNGCNSLEIIIVYATTPPTWAVGSANLAYMVTNYKIYVPDASVATYKSATGWTNASSHIYSINDL